VLTALLIAGLLVATAFALVVARRHRKLTIKLAEIRASSPIEEETMLRNRATFLEDLNLEQRRCDRSGQPAALVVLGIARDALSAAPPAASIADSIRATVRQVDVGYRIGSHEFALILPSTRARGALVAARRVAERLLADGTPGASVTAGVAELGPGIDNRQVFRNAYTAMLAAGRNDRSQILAYSPELERTYIGEGLPDPAEIEALEGPAG
jgi:GGDEF domain-containing protein